MEARLLTAEQEAQRHAADAREQAQRLQVGLLSSGCHVMILLLTRSHPGEME